MEGSALYTQSLSHLPYGETRLSPLLLFFSHKGLRTPRRSRKPKEQSSRASLQATRLQRHLYHATCRQDCDRKSCTLRSRTFEVGRRTDLDLRRLSMAVLKSLSISNWVQSYLASVRSSLPHTLALPVPETMLARCRL